LADATTTTTTTSTDNPIIAATTTAPALDLSVPAQPASLPETTCTAPPLNGTVLHRRLPKGPHVVEIDNGTSGPAIVKIRSTENRHRLVSFVVTENSSASVDIPDGSYRIQYAHGSRFAANCKSLAKPFSANTFPSEEHLKTTYTDLNGSTREAIFAKLTYTLYAVPGGNVRPEQIASSDFEAD
jgi:hypothetical protein